jgi:hypothetical protein
MMRWRRGSWSLRTVGTGKRTTTRSVRVLKQPAKVRCRTWLMHSGWGSNVIVQ